MSRRLPAVLLAMSLALPAAVASGWADPRGPASGARPAVGDELDPTFGTGGRVTTALDGGLAANAVAIDASGRIVAAGAFAPTGNPFERLEWLVARYLSTGQPDTSFYGNGYRIDATYRCDSDTCDVAGPIRAVLTLADGRIVAGGDEGDRYLLARYLANGQLDAAFGDAGWVHGPYESDYKTMVRGLAAGPSGSVIALVAREDRSGASATYGLLRLTSAGQPDEGFGDFGWHYEAFTPVVARALVALPSGRLLVAGYNDYGDSPGFTSQCVVAKYWANGAARDDSFGQSGMAMFTFDQGGQFDACFAMAVQADGRIVVTGQNNEHLGLARLLSDGTLDPGFNQDGRLILSSVGSQDSLAGYGAVVDAGGRALVAGAEYLGIGTSHWLALRLTPAGALDPTFGTDGRVTTLFGATYHGEAFGLALQPNGRVVAGGYDQASESSARLALARYRNDTSAPTASPTATASATASATATATATETAAGTASPTPTSTATATASATASPTASATASASPTATSTGYLIRGQVRLERRPSSAGARVCLGAACATTDADGAFQLAAEARGGGLALVAGHPSYLRAERPFSAPAAGTTVDVPTVTLLSGDLNQDGKVEVDDAAMVGQRFNLRYDPAQPGPPWLEACDITDDDLIDIRDMVGVQYNLLKTAPSPWP